MEFQNLDPKARMSADVFQAGRQVGSIEVPGTLRAADARGRIYVAEEEGFPKVVRYAVKTN